MSKAGVSPYDALRKGDVSSRALAARELAASGTAQDVAELVDRAKVDKSPSVRLYAAAAAADVALRTVGDADDDVRASWVAGVTTVDPGSNPSLLMVLAALPTSSVLERLGRTLRDPRYDVRAGAATALRRMACARIHSVDAHAEVQQRLRTTLSGWLEAGRHPPDAVLELVRICGEAGLTWSEAAEGAALSVGRGIVEVLDEASARLRARGDLEAYQGVWISWGSDVMQPTADEPETWRYVASTGEVTGPGASDVLRIDASPTLAGQTVRLVWAARPGMEASQVALQTPARTYWRCSGEALVEASRALLTEIEQVPAAAAGIAVALDEVDGQVAQRIRGRLMWRGGDAEGALAVLEELEGGKKPHADALWALAQVRTELGNAKAKATILRALKAAPKKCSWRQEAEALAESAAG